MAKHFLHILTWIGIGLSVSLMYTAALDASAAFSKKDAPAVSVSASAADMPETNSPAAVRPVYAPTLPVPEPAGELLGKYTVTAYCGCRECCGKWADCRENGIVKGAEGAELVSGVSCAASLPFGTEIYIDGIGTYTVQDRTSPETADRYDGRIIQIYFTDHQTACDFGVRHCNIYRIR